MRRSIGTPGKRLALEVSRMAPAASMTFLLLVVGLATAPVPSAVSPSVVAAGPGPCLGGSASATASGLLALVGNATPRPSVANVAVQVAYFYTEVLRINGTTTESCVPATANGTTAAGGNFSLHLPIPPNHCVRQSVCVAYSGPYEPLGFTSSSAPAGFLQRDSTGGTSPGTIQWDADLYQARLNVSGTLVVSTNAPVDLSATATTGAGGPSPGPLAYTWDLAGLEWGISSQKGPNVTVVGTDSGWTGSLSVSVQATYGGTQESAQSAVLSLVPVPTRLLLGVATPSPVDPGVPVEFLAVGSGASGYAYSATVDPGLGAGSVTAPCTAIPPSNGTENLTCRVPAAYPVAGTAFPQLSISNGFSTAQLSLAPLPVHPVEEVTLQVLSPVTYANRIVEATANVTNGTGTAPYGPACLSVSGIPGSTCLPGNASSWEFHASLGTTGDYELRVSVGDRFGENVSASSVVVVVPFLTARANGSSAVTLLVNQTTGLSVVVEGGALPLTTWWNRSGSLGILCWGNLAFDGTISCPFLSAVAGLDNLTVTFRDALGTEATVLFRITVTLPAPRAPPSGGSLLSGSTGAVILAGVVAVAVALAVVTWKLRRRGRTASAAAREDRVEETELERMARGREHLLSQADPERPRRPDELVARWTGPPVAPEEWAEWLAALVADGSLIPSRGGDRRLVYRRVAPRPLGPTIEFDPTMFVPAHPPTDSEEGAPEPNDR